ncbi:hypothetical protein N9N67_04835 [Bacteriovoracaceae bacterium]|nr:hypothetical protein [Bacteriovoracaceae bacterium]
MVINCILSCLLLYSSILLSNSDYKFVQSVFGKMPLLKDKCIQKIWEQIPPRDVKADRNVQSLVSRSIEKFKHNYIILDSGHAHSIAASKILLKNGYAPKFYFEVHRDDKTGKKDLGVSIQAVAAMKYYATEFSHLKKGNKPAIVLDTHRSKNIKSKFFLKIDDLLSKFEGRVTWVTEGFKYYKNRFISYKGKSKNIIDDYVSYFEYESKSVVKLFLKNQKVNFSQFFADPYIDHDEYIGYEKYSVDLGLRVLPKECRGWQF